MCPISGLVQFLIVVVTLLLICHSVVVQSLKIKFQPSNSTIHMYDSVNVNYTITGNDIDVYKELKCYSEDNNIATINEYVTKSNPSLPYSGSFNITGNFLGKTVIYCKIKRTNERIPNNLEIIVTRKVRPIDKIFSASVAILVSIIYINFGCALDWGNMLQTIKHPIGPAIGFFGQFIIMPLLSFGLGKILFPGNYPMQLGMFFTGASPAGGASNIWTVVLDGNVNLSITMTTISTFAAFAMMPFWLFTLGHLIFDQADIKVPYKEISMYAIALIVPLAIGYLISKYLKKIGQFLVKILKGFSGGLLLFIIIFAIVTNLYLFELFSWQIIIAGMGLPYLGFILGYAIAIILKQPSPDCLAIAIETGIQNTGIAIFMLRFSLPQPQADLTTVVPVAVAMMTPLPLLCLFIIKKIKSRLPTDKKHVNGKNGIYIVDSNSNQTENHLLGVCP